MYGGNYGQYDELCKRALPMRCQKCGAKIDYKTLYPFYYDFLCGDCIEWDKKDDKIGELTKEMKQKIESQASRYELKYGYSCSVVITKHGIFFEDIC